LAVQRMVSYSGA